MCLCNPQPPDEVHKNSGEHGGHKLSPDLQPTRLERGPTAPQGLQDAAGIARAAGQRRAVQDGETVGERERRVRLGLHVAEQAELVSARTHLEGAESLQEEGAEVWVGVQAAANQAPAQSHRRHDACHQQQRRPDATDGHGETERRVSQGGRTRKGSAGSAPAPPPPPPTRRKERGKGREDGSAQPLREEEAASFPTCPQPARWQVPPQPDRRLGEGVQAEGGGSGPGHPSAAEEGTNPPRACGTGGQRGRAGANPSLPAPEEKIIEPITPSQPSHGLGGARRGEKRLKKIKINK